MFNRNVFFENSSDIFAKIYANRNIDFVKARYNAAFDEFENIYGEADTLSVFSVAGRSEICGNHTDHNYGKVLAASIDLDIIAIVKKTNDAVIRVKSAGFPEDIVSTEALTPKISDTGRSSALIRGVCDGFVKNGHKIGGFTAYTTSDILGGSGLSSSAAFEDMIGTILNYLYNDGNIDYIEISKISQYAENVYFGKPCGLMDQVACALGGVVAIDFADPSDPTIEQIRLDLDAKGYRLCIVNTGGNHADLTDDYASVPAEMKSVANALGKHVLREVDEHEFFAALPTLRTSLSDRAVLRAMHFFAENARVETQKKLLLAEDFDGFLSQVIASGRSSFCYLQNVYAPKNPTEQGISLALCLAEQELSGIGAWRVHGGGFAGTIQAYVPTAHVSEFRSRMEQVFGKGACTVLRIRSESAMRIL